MLTRILVIDDHPVTREGIRLAIRARRPESVVNICDSIAAARDHLRHDNRYKLILLDYRLPDSAGLSGLFTIQAAAPRTPVAILTASSGSRLAPVARSAGAAGFVSKAQPMEEIAEAIESVLAGSAVFPEDGETDEAIIALRDRIVTLSGAQLQVLVALLNGALNKQIGAELNLTEATIKAHLTAIFRKLGVTGRMEAVDVVRPLFSDLELDGAG